MDRRLLPERELREDDVRVLLDRRLREREGIGGGRVRLALGHLAEDVDLTRREVTKRRGRFDTPAADQGFHEYRVHHRSTSSRLAERAHQLVAVSDPLLEQVGVPGDAVAQSSIT